MPIKKKIETSLVLPATPEFIERRIHLVRGQKVMLDSDLAELYQVETKRLNEQVRRNVSRFPEDFMFQLVTSEISSLNRSQIATGSRKHRNIRYRSYVFTELGIAMLSSVLNSERAVQMNIFIMRAFVKLRQVIASNKDLAHKVDKLELEQNKQGLVLAEIYSAVKKFMDSPVPKKEKIGFNISSS